MTSIAALGRDVAAVLGVGVLVLVGQFAIYSLLGYARPNIRFHKLRNDRTGDIVFLIRNLDAVRYRDALRVALEPAAAVARVRVHAGPHCPDPPALDATAGRIAIAFTKVPADATFSIQVQRKDLGRTIKIFLDPSSPLRPRKFDTPLPPMAGIRRIGYFGVRFAVGLGGFVVLFCTGAHLQGWELQAVDWAFIAAGLPVALAVFTLVVPTGGKPLVAGYLGWRGASKDWPAVDTPPAITQARSAASGPLGGRERELLADGAADAPAPAVPSEAALRAAADARTGASGQVAARAVESDPVLAVAVEARAEASSNLRVLAGDSEKSTAAAVTASADTLVVVALAEEHNPFRQCLALAHHAAPLDHWTAVVPTAAGEPRTVALVVQKEMGGIEAAALTSRAIALLGPRVVVMTGILGGFQSQDVALGDIVIAGLSVDYATGKVSSGAHGPSGAADAADEIRRRLSVQKLEGPLAARVQAWVTNDQDDRLRSRFLSAIRPELLGVIAVSDSFGSRIHCGPIASGPLVVASDRFAEKLRTIDDKLLGVEMEIHGVMRAADCAGLPVIGIKAVSDLADGDKSSPRGVDGPAARTFAAHASARLCVQLIRDGVL